MAKKLEKIVLTDIEKFYIAGHYDQSSEDLARLFNKPVELVEQYKMHNPPPKAEDPIYHTPKPPTSADLMARQMVEANGGKVGAIVLTQAASEVADEKRKIGTAKDTSSYIVQCKKK